MKRISLLLAGVLALALVAGCGGQAKPDAPAAATPPKTEQTAPPAGTGSEKPADANGTFAITAQESVASYAVKEKFLQQNLNGEAVGKTSVINGTLVLTGGSFSTSKVTVDVSTLKSDKEKRDDVLKTRALETAKYPTAEFEVTGVEGPAPAFAEGRETAFKLKGNLTVHGVTKPVIWEAAATLTGTTLNLKAKIGFKMSEFAIEPPNVLNLISVDDTVQLTVDLKASKR
ncbi:MAG TPA: YceI family protein [Symbiobacteriaceae bacterium]|nr:YceI family protein [Symbiobacteriaceae bacterium]